MPTQRQIESARINGAKSRGPKTPEGKRRSSANARKHGLTSKTLATDPESAPHFDALVAQYVADLRPASPAELLLIDQMAAANIRQRQAWAAEAEAWNRALAAHNGCVGTAAKMLAESGELACIIRYETRFSRQSHRALQQFLTARALRLRNEPEPSARPATILQNEPEPPPSNPSPHGNFAKRTGSSHPRRCSHPAFLQDQPRPAPIPRHARDKVACSPGQ